MLEPSPAFPDTPFQEVALDSSLEKFLRDGYEDAAEVFAVPCGEDISDGAVAAMSSPGKKTVYAFLATQSFFFRKSGGHFSCL